MKSRERLVLADFDGPFCFSVAPPAGAKLGGATLARVQRYTRPDGTLGQVLTWAQPDGQKTLTTLSADSTRGPSYAPMLLLF